MRLWHLISCLHHLQSWMEPAATSTAQPLTSFHTDHPWTSVPLKPSNLCPTQCPHFIACCLAPLHADTVLAAVPILSSSSCPFPWDPCNLFYLPWLESSSLSSATIAIYCLKCVVKRQARLVLSHLPHLATAFTTPKSAVLLPSKVSETSPVWWVTWHLWYQQLFPSGWA